MTQKHITDSDLLELAAKAHGGVERNDDYGWIDDSKDTPTQLWSPLTDDGDAHRLAVKLRLYVAHNDGKVFVDLPENEGRVYAAGSAWTGAGEPYGDDQYAASRRAIVRAAAEIGKAMP